MHHNLGGLHESGLQYNMKKARPRIVIMFCKLSVGYGFRAPVLRQKQKMQGSETRKLRDGPLEKLSGGWGGGEFSSCTNFFR